MALLLLGLLLLSSAVLLLTRRDRKTFLIFAMNLALVEFWLMMLIYIAKKGGIATEMQTLLYGSRAIRLKLQYMVFTLQQMGYLMAIGRYLFPFLLLWIVLQESYFFRKYRTRRVLAGTIVFPALSLIIYYPPVFEWCIGLNRSMIGVLVHTSLSWIVLYLVAAVVMLFFELHDISMPFYKRKFLGKIVSYGSLVVLYALYAPQDPAQVYLFYRNEYMGAVQGLWYLSPALSVRNYIIAFVLVILCTLIGSIMQFRYARMNLREDQEEIAIQRKFDAASKGANVFVHSVKNQLLANRVLLKRIEAALRTETLDRDVLLDYHHQLVENNAYMIDRMEELYKGVRTNAITLVPEQLSEVLQMAVDHLHRKYPAAEIRYTGPENIRILCDKNHFSEMLYNILLNGWEAQIQTDRDDLPLEVLIHQERMWTVLEITDHGVGIPKAQLRHIFDPFFSSKNTNMNWGMGLYYARSIIKSHLGVLRINTVLGKGSTFLIQIPKYDVSAENKNQDPQG